MAAPIKCWTPAFPRVLGLTYNLRQHEENLTPFLNSIRFPFTWMFEPEDLYLRLREKEHKEAEESYRSYMKYSKDRKDEGNAAFQRGDREGAIAKFHEAAENLERLLLRKISEPEEKDAEVRHALAICLSNSAAARMIAIDGKKDARGAIQDAEGAIKADPAYPKS